MEWKNAFYLLLYPLFTTIVGGVGKEQYQKFPLQWFSLTTINNPLSYSNVGYPLLSEDSSARSLRPLYTKYDKLNLYRAGELEKP